MDDSIFDSISSKKYQRRYFLAYTILFAAAAACVFFLFEKNGVSFIWGKVKPGSPSLHDGWNQHYKALIYYSRWLRDIVHETITSGRLVIPAFSASIGLGSDVIQTLQYYVIGDPLALFSVFVPEKYMAVFYTAMIVLRFYLSGIAFSIYAIYMGRKMNAAGKTAITYTAVLAGSVIYTFSGYALFAGIRHPYFMTPVVFFPLVLYGVEKVLHGERPYALIAAVSLSCMSNFYFFYMIVILTVIYTIVRVMTSCRIKSSEPLKKIVKVFIPSLLGTLTAAAALLPAVYAVLSSSRSGSGSQASLLPDLTTAGSEAASFFAPMPESSNWTFIGISTISVTALVVFFSKRKDLRAAKILLAIMTVMILCPVLSKAMNGFTYPANRWTWGYILLLSFIITCVWDDLPHMDKKEKLTALSLLTFFFICTLVIKLPYTTTGFTFAAVAGLMIFSAFAVIRGEKAAQTAAVVLIVFNIAGNAFFLYSNAGWGYMRQFVRFSRVNRNIDLTEGTIFRRDIRDNSGFYRYSGYAECMWQNDTMLTGLHSTQYYWSLENGNITRFRDENGVADTHTAFSYSGFEGRAMLNALSNVKYMISPSRPYGYRLEGTYRLAGRKRYTIWKNKYFLPFGYTYSGWIDKKKYDALPAESKQEALMQGCIVENTDGHGREITPKTTARSLKYRISSRSRSIEISRNKIITHSEGTHIRITFRGSRGGETYVKFSDLKFYPKAAVPRVTHSKISGAMTNGAGRTRDAAFTCRARDDTHYHSAKSMMLTFTEGSSGKCVIDIRLQKRGTYTFSGISVISQPMKVYRKGTSKLRRDTMENVDLHDDNLSHTTNRITGDITLRKPKYLLLSIPWSTGWSCRVDGKKVKLIKADTMYSAVRLNKGTHRISMTYETPGLRAGAYISLAGILMTAAYVFLTERSKRRLDQKDDGRKWKKDDFSCSSLL